MYAIIRAGGKQYRVEPGDVLRLEKVEADLGSELDLTEVLAIGGDKLIVGEPTVADAKVTVVVTNQRKAPRIIIFKKKRRQGYRRLTGHRQPYTEVFVKSISSPSGTVMAEAAPKVFNEEKKMERTARKDEYRVQAKAEARKASSAKAETAVATTKKKAAPKKKVAKKAAPKKASAKKGAAKAKAKTTKKASGTTKKSK